MNEKEYYEALLNSSVPTDNSLTSADSKALTASENNALTNGYNGGTYQQAIDNAVEKYLSSSGLNYTTANDKDYQTYKQQYAEGAQQAADNSANISAQLSGGYGTSSADIVASEGKNASMENVTDAVPQFKSAEGNVQSGKLAQQANSVQLLSTLDKTEYSDSQNAQQNNANMLNNQLSRYSADAQIESQRNSDNANIYQTKLSAAQQNLADKSNYYNNLYNYNTQSAESAAQNAEKERESANNITESNYENKQKIDYSKAEDAYSEKIAAAKAEDAYSEKIAAAKAEKAALKKEKEKRYIHNAEKFIKAYNLTKNTDYSKNQIAIGYYHGYITSGEAKAAADKLNISFNDIADEVDIIEKNGGTVERSHGQWQ